MFHRRGPFRGLAVVTVPILAASILAASALGSSTAAGSVGHGKAGGAATVDVSSNWAGYVAIGPGSTSTTASSGMAYTDVTGQWIVPTATCSTGRSTSVALWVGLGGYSESSEALEQTGTSADCSANGEASYYAWYELVPADSVNVKGLRIFPGDVIASTVLIKGTDVLVQVKDRTRNTSFTKHLRMRTPDLTSAEWIAEAPSECGASGSCRAIPLTNFGTVTFSRAYAWGNGTPGTITSPSWMSTSMQLIPHARRAFGDPNDPTSTTGGAGAAPGGLAPDGTGFSVSWQANPGASS